jgi:hypothetical protein
MKIVLSSTREEGEEIQGACKMSISVCGYVHCDLDRWGGHVRILDLVLCSSVGFAAYMDRTGFCRRKGVQYSTTH